MTSVTFTRLSKESTRKLGSFIEQVRQKPYRFLSAQPFGAQISKIVLEDIVDLNTNHPESVIVAWQGGEIAGLAACDDLPWDSRVLQSRWGSLKYLLAAPWAGEKQKIFTELILNALAWAQVQRKQCMVAKVNTDDVALLHALQQTGFLYMDANLDYAVDLRDALFDKIRQPILPTGITIRQAEACDANDLLVVAGKAFQSHFSRYMVDEMIPEELARNVYVEWMRSCFYADLIHVIEANGRTAGYSAWKKSAPAELDLGIRLGHLSIIGIHPEFTGLGLGSNLIYAGMNTMGATVDIIDSRTHINNYPMQHVFQNLGWHIYDVRHTYHKWLAGSGDE
jgi:ribosomal protein S18 acetylase RimI-like enzyme